MLDIIEAWKKSGFSIEDVMKKYGLKKSTVYRLLAEKEKYTQQEVNTMWTKVRIKTIQLL